MEFAVLGEEDDPTVLAFGGDLVVQPLSQALGKGPDRRVAGDVVRLEAEPAFSDEAVALALDEHRFRAAVQFGVLVLPPEIPSLDQRVSDDRPGRQGRQEGERLLQFLPLVAGFGDDQFPIDRLVRSRDGHIELRRKDRKSTRLNSSHEWISYAVFCLKKKI